MNRSVDIPGTGAFAVWEFQRSTGVLGQFEVFQDVGWFNAHARVEVYWTQANGSIERIGTYDPWWRVK
jgi:hypothetical protein